MGFNSGFKGLTVIVMISYYCCNICTLYVTVMTYYTVHISRQPISDHALPPFHGPCVYTQETQNPARFYPLSPHLQPAVSQVALCDPWPHLCVHIINISLKFGQLGVRLAVIFTPVYRDPTHNNGWGILPLNF